MLTIARPAPDLGATDIVEGRGEETTAAVSRPPCRGTSATGISWTPSRLHPTLDHGLTSSTPVSAKSFTFLVARTALCTMQIAAI